MNLVAARLGASDTVIVINDDPSGFAELSLDFPGEKIVGCAFDRTHLERTGIEHADAFLAASESDELNMVSSRVARDTYQVPKVVARLRDPAKARILARLGVETVAAVEWIADEVMRLIGADASAAEWEDGTSSVVLVERRPTQGWVGRSIDDLAEPGKFAVAVLTRMGTARTYEPGLVVQEDDILHFVAATGCVQELDAKIDRPEEFA